MRTFGKSEEWNLGFAWFPQELQGTEPLEFRRGWYEAERRQFDRFADGEDREDDGCE